LVTEVLTLAQTKQIRINIYKRKKNKKTQCEQYKTVNSITHITRAPTELSKHPHITKPTHTHTSTHYKAS